MSAVTPPEPSLCRRRRHGTLGSVTKPRRRTVVAAIAAALPTGAAVVAFAVVSRADDGARRVDTTGNFVGPSTPSADDSTTLVSLVPVPSGPTVMTLPAAGGR